MTRTIRYEQGRFVVSDDPDRVIGALVGMLVGNLAGAELDAAVAPDGDGLSVDSFGAVFRVEERSELPEPWDADPTLDPELDPAATELWVLWRDGRPPCKLVIGGDELRDLVARARVIYERR
jgi:hypothetical protein